MCDIKQNPTLCLSGDRCLYYKRGCCRFTHKLCSKGESCIIPLCEYNHPTIRTSCPHEAKGEKCAETCDDPECYHSQIICRYRHVNALCKLHLPGCSSDFKSREEPVIFNGDSHYFGRICNGCRLNVISGMNTINQVLNQKLPSFKLCPCNHGIIINNQCSLLNCPLNNIVHRCRLDFTDCTGIPMDSEDGKYNLLIAMKDSKDNIIETKVVDVGGYCQNCIKHWQENAKVLMTDTDFLSRTHFKHCTCGGFQYPLSGFCTNSKCKYINPIRECMLSIDSKCTGIAELKNTTITLSDNDYKIPKCCNICCDNITQDPLSLISFVAYTHWKRFGENKFQWIFGAILEPEEPKKCVICFEEGEMTLSSAIFNCECQVTMCGDCLPLVKRCPICFKLPDENKSKPMCIYGSPKIEELNGYSLCDPTNRCQCRINWQNDILVIITAQLEEGVRITELSQMYQDLYNNR